MGDTPASDVLPPRYNTEMDEEALRRKGQPNAPEWVDKPFDPFELRRLRAEIVDLAAKNAQESQRSFDAKWKCTGSYYSCEHCNNITETLKLNRHKDGCEVCRFMPTAFVRGCIELQGYTYHTPEHVRRLYGDPEAIER